MSGRIRTGAGPAVGDILQKQFKIIKKNVRFTVTARPAGGHPIRI